MDATDAIAMGMAGGTRSGLGVWLPWLLAPAFLLLPIGGCGVAAAVRRQPAVVLRPPEPGPGPAVETVATVGSVVTQMR